MRQKLSSNSANIAGLVAAVGGFLYSYDTGLINILEMQYVKQTIPAIKHSFNVHERALITAILSLGTFVGALIAPLLSDSYGRKLSIIATTAIIFNAGNILQVAATNSVLLCAGRAVSGLAVGILSVVVPLYQAEASPKWACFFSRKARATTYRKNIQAVLESLCKLQRLHSDDSDLLEELVGIKANYDYEMSFGRSLLLECFRSSGGRHKQALPAVLRFNFLLYYGVKFFARTGITNYFLMSFVTHLVNVVFTVPGIFFIDIIGRRKLLLLGGVGMAVSNFVIAIVGIIISSQNARSIISILCLCLFIVCFAFSWGGCTWAVFSDIFGISIRQKAVYITTAANWLVNFVFAYTMPYLIDAGSHTAAFGNKIFFICGGCNITKGLKLEKMDLMYQNCTNSHDTLRFKSRKVYASLANGDTMQGFVNTLPNEWMIGYILHEKDASNSLTDITPLTSFTSASILRGPGDTSKTVLGPSDERGVSIVSRNGNTLSYTELRVSATNYLSDSIQLNKYGNMKIIAVPFYNNSPSGSDSEE
ncbi:hypothetical protein METBISCDRAFT_22828 [Metschnikowia bicuspidata]|uniref:Major facilitator superfamily (MFS) profile domain-containing protein n=1 Tax=Metschnikowia bicuspidata TaxID=27322 RepID=A0A4P9ZER7_9ASCO|nr:hypothetical protein METBISCDRAFT_22828 [Metschnikowia bicuspidata]